MNKSHDLVIGGLWWDELQRIEDEYPDYELVDWDTHDGHNYTAYLRRRWR